MVKDREKQEKSKIHSTLKKRKHKLQMMHYGCVAYETITRKFNQEFILKDKSAPY